MIVSRKAGSKIPLKKGKPYTVLYTKGIPVTEIRINPDKDTWYDIGNFDIITEVESKEIKARVVDEGILFLPPTLNKDWTHKDITDYWDKVAQDRFSKEKAEACPPTSPIEYPTVDEEKAFWDKLEEVRLERVASLKKSKDRWAEAKKEEELAETNIPKTRSWMEEQEMIHREKRKQEGARLAKYLETLSGPRIDWKTEVKSPEPLNTDSWNPTKEEWEPTKQDWESYWFKRNCEQDAKGVDKPTAEANTPKLKAQAILLKIDKVIRIILSLPLSIYVTLISFNTINNIDKISRL